MSVIAMLRYRRGRDRGIARGPAGLQHLEAGLGGERMTGDHHSVDADDRTVERVRSRCDQSAGSERSDARQRAAPPYRYTSVHESSPCASIFVVACEATVALPSPSINDHDLRRKNASPAGSPGAGKVVAGARGRVTKFGRGSHGKPGTTRRRPIAAAATRLQSPVESRRLALSCRNLFSTTPRSILFAATAASSIARPFDGFAIIRTLPAKGAARRLRSKMNCFAAISMSSTA